MNLSVWHAILIQYISMLFSNYTQCYLRLYYRCCCFFVDVELVLKNHFHLVKVVIIYRCFWLLAFVNVVFISIFSYFSISSSIT